jgi:hypothetical protein
MHTLIKIKEQIDENIASGKLFFQEVKELNDISSFLFTPEQKDTTTTTVLNDAILEIKGVLSFMGQDVSINAVLEQKNKEEQVFKIEGTLPLDYKLNIAGISWFSIESVSVFFETQIISLPQFEEITEDTTITNGGLKGLITTASATLDATINFPTGSNTLWSLKAS